ncbi:MAG TPA: GNAT family N-acetyltransferase [Gammaproteobacteria bacterium]|nr:GNAT family N-acetyltransferase [Gammaproteobacteria bacterium]
MIEPVDNNNIDDLLPLVRAYQEFYGAADINDESNRAFFAQFSENSESGCQFLFRRDGAAIAFATVYFNFSSTLAAKVGVLNDLYTTPAYRSSGVGRELIEHCRQFAQRRGAIRLQWLTATDNLTAQRLYDSLDTRKSDWHFYTYSTGTGP